MEKLLKIIFFLLVGVNSIAQPTQGIQYQSVLRDNEGNLQINQQLVLRISIIETSPVGEVVYKEEHQATTNNFGLLNLIVGQGIPLINNFSNIDWSKGNFFLGIEKDSSGSGDFEPLGVSQLLSVPFSFYAEESGLKNVPALNQTQIDNLNPDTGSVVLNTTTQCLNYFTGLTWMEMCGNCTPQPSVANAGEDQNITGTETTLEANQPEIGTGLWQIISGSGGTITQPNQHNSPFSGIQGNEYELLWTISNNCGINSDLVVIHFLNEPPPAVEGLTFAPYVDCLLWPNFDISNIALTGICNYTCAFIVDNQFQSGANPCWGGYSTLGTEYYQDKIAALRAQGGDIIMSFGGANGIELAYAASNEFEARDAYKTMIQAYNLTSIDFDIEGFLVAEPLSRHRRSKAMKLLQNEFPYLKISLTLPVMPDGLTNDGKNTVASALSQGVDLDIINIMAMDYGPSGIDMGAAAISAGEALFVQLKSLYQNAGISQPDSIIWSKIGICPMIGENDVQGEIFYLNDALDLANWASQKKIGRLTMWSANRDKACTNPNDPLYSCSRIEQELFEFSSIFSAVSTNSCNSK
jgi:hypothetical protein